jgi:hypothetical protein
MWWDAFLGSGFQVTRAAVPAAGRRASQVTTTGLDIGPPGAVAVHRIGSGTAPGRAAMTV